MKKSRKNEELQSRREFFRKAAKGALPILAAVAFAGTPGIVKAAEEAPLGCRFEACVGGCHNSCSGSCVRTCTGCHNTCSGNCKYHAKN